MNGLQIINVISKDESLLSQFGGLFAIDQLTFLPERGKFYICNTDIASKEGKHWIVIYFPKNATFIEYFDSLGKKPHEAFLNFMTQTNRQVIFNKKRLQGTSSDACGYFCLYFALLRSRNINYKDIIDNFSNSHDINEKYVTKFIKHSLS